MTSSLALAGDGSVGADKTVTGVLICNHCGSGMMTKDDPEAAAAKHSKACALKEACAASGFTVISGKEQTKLDAASADKAKAYLSKEDNPSKATVKGNLNSDGTLRVASIEPAKG
jgi:hypothetical protein